MTSEEAISRVNGIGQASLHLHLAAKIGIPTVIDQAGTPITAAQVCKKLPIIGKMAFAAAQGRDSRLNTKPNALAPIMKFLSSAGIFMEEKDGGVLKFASTKKSQLLARGTALEIIDHSATISILPASTVRSYNCRCSM